MTKLKKKLPLKKKKRNEETPTHINYTEEQLRVATHGGRGFKISFKSIAKNKINLS